VTIVSLPNTSGMSRIWLCEGITAITAEGNSDESIPSWEDDSELEGVSLGTN